MTTIDAAATAGTISSNRRWAVLAVLAVVIAAEILDLLDSTITNIAAPTITADLHGGASLVQWLGTSHALAFGALLVVGGRLGDRFGRRRLFLIGIGSLAAVQQRANAIGAAAVTTVYFRTLGAGHQAHVMTVGLVVVGGATLLSCCVVWLLPRRARPRQH